jgi:hypothetical protein
MFSARHKVKASVLGEDRIVDGDRGVVEGKPERCSVIDVFLPCPPMSASSRPNDIAPNKPTA